jgi:hypothetical protein
VFYRLGLKIVTHARLVLVVGVVALVISAVLGVGAFARLLSGGFDDPASASSQAKVLLDQRFGGEPDMIFLVHARTGTVDGTAVTAAGLHRLGWCQPACVVSRRTETHAADCGRVMHRRADPGQRDRRRTDR